MAKDENKKKFWERKRLLFFIGYLVVLPIICIACLYIFTYTGNKPELFVTESSTTTTTTGEGEEKIKYTKIKGFEIDVTATEVTKATKTTSGSIKIAASIHDVNKNYNISSVTIQYQLDCNWTDKATVTNTNVRSFNSGNQLLPDTEYNATSTTITHDVLFPIKPLPFVKVTSHNIYALVSYVETDSAGNTHERKSILTLEWDDYVTSTTVLK